MNNPGNIQTDEEMKKMLQELGNKLDEYEAKEAKRKLVEKFYDRVIEMKIPLKFIREYKVEDVDELETLIEKVKADYEADQQKKRKG
jgi:protein-tyrosine-phosphatase